MEVITAKYETTHAIWFKNSKSFLLLEAPAFMVFENYRQKKSVQEITRLCQNKYGHLEEDIPAFVGEIIEHIESYNNAGNVVSVSRKAAFSNTPVCSASDALSASYKVGKKLFQISYANHTLKFAIHPIIAHLEIETDEVLEDKIECIEQNGILVLKHNEQLIEAFARANIEYFTGALKQLLISLLHHENYYYWMAMLHASGITHNKQAILFSAASGSGKSTISALLKAKGYGYIADDFIASDKNGNAFAFPDAISVKQGSFKALADYYPVLKKTNEQQTFIGKTVRYLPVINTAQNGVKVKAFVFVNYTKTEAFVFENVDKKMALQLLLKETWVNPESEFVSAFFDWVENTDFYQLQYSKIEEAEQVVQEIFGE